MHLDWSTLTLQTVNVLVLLWLLQRYLFRPVMGIIAARRQAAETLLAEAAQRREMAQATEDDLKRRAQGSAAEAAQLRAAAQTEAAAERARLLGDVRAEIDKLRGEAAAALRRDRAAQRSALESQAGELAMTIAFRLLSRLPGPSATAAMLALLDADLAALPPDQLRALAGPLEVVSAAPLTAEEQAACTALLGRRLDPSLSLHFSVDPALLAGIDLRGAHTVLRRSWQAELDRIVHDLKLESADAGPVLA